MHWNRFPKWYLFQAQMLSIEKSRQRGNLDREAEADGILPDAFQLSSTREGKVGLVSHICSNRNCLGDFHSKGSIISKMGQWSDLTLEDGVLLLQEK